MTAVFTKAFILEEAAKIDGWLRFGEDYSEPSIIYDLADKYIAHNGLVVEIGSWKGKSAFIWGNICRQRNAKLICIDTFAGTEDTPTHPKLKNTYKEAYLDPEAFFKNNIEKNLVGLPVSYLKGFSRDMHTYIKNESADIVFIDGDHSYEVVKQDIQNYLPKVKKGGLLCGHDYYAGVKQAVDELLGSVKVERTIWQYTK